MTPSYLSVLTDIANGRFALNAERLQRLEDSIRTALAALPTPSPEEAACNTSAMGQPGAGWTATAGSSSTLAPTRAIATTTTAAAAAAASVEAAAAAARETTLAARAAVAATRGKASSSSLVTGAPPPGSKAAGRLAKSARVAAAKASAKALKRAVKMNYSNGTVDTTRNTDGSSSSTRSLNSITTRSSKKHQPSALNPDPGLSSASQLAGNATGPVWAASVALLNGSSRNEVGSIAPNNNSSSSSIKSEIDPCQWKVLSFGGFGPCQGGGSVRRLSASKTLHGTTHDYRVAAGAPMNVKVAAAAAANVTTGAEPCPRESAALAMLYAPGTGSSDIGPLRGPVAVLFGGRESPSKPLGDAWYWTEETPFSDSTTSSSTSSLCRSNGSWRALQRPSSPSFSSSSPHHFGIEVAGEWPCPRWGHTLTSLGPGVLLLFGGCDHLGTVGVNSNDSGSEGDADDGRGVAYLLIANSKDSVHDTGKRIAWRWQRLSLTAGAIAAATGSANLARFDHSATLVPISAASFTADKVFSVASQFNSTVVVYGGWHDAAVDVQPSASVVVLDLTIDFDDAKQLLKANTCRIRRPLGVAHPSLPLLTSREGHSNILRRANHSAVGLATHLVVFGGAGDSVSGDDSLAAFALPWTALLSQGGDHNNSSDGGVGVGVGVGNDESEASSKDGNGSTSIVVAEAIQWADGSSGGGGGGFLEAFVKGAAVALPPAPPAPWSTLMSPGSLSVSNEGHDDAANAASSSSSSNNNNHSGSRGSAGNDVVSAAAWAVGTPPCSARGEQRALLLGGGLPLLGFGPHFCAHTTTAAVVTLRFASKDDNSSHAVGHTTTTTTTTTTNTANTVSSSNNSSPHAIADSSSDRMVHTAWFEPISFGHSDSDGAATPTLKSEESRETAEPAAGVSWAAEVRARSRRKHGAAAAVALSAQSGQSGQPASLVSTSSQASTKVPATSQGTNSRAFDTFVAKVSTAERRTGHNNNQMADTSSCEVVAAPANATKKLKAALEACGYLDKGWRIAPAAGAIPETLAAAKMSLAKDSNEEFTLDYTGWLALPLTTDGTAAVDAALAAISDAATAAVDCEETVAQAAAVSSGASRVLTTALVGAMRSVVITSTTVAIPPDGSAPGSDSTGKAKLGAESPLRWPLLPRGRAVDGGLPLNKAKLSGQRSKLECAVVALLLEAHHQNLLHTANSSSQMMSQGRSTNASGDKKIVEAALRTAVLSSSLFAGSNNLERVGDTAILLPEACLPPSELAQWPWSLLNAPSSHDAHSSEKKSCNSSAVRNAGDSEPSDAGTVAVAALWKCIAVSHNVRLIARAARIDDGPKRASRVRLLYAAPLILSPPLPLSSSSLSSSNAHSEPSKNEDGVQAPPLPSWHGGVDQEGRSLSAGPYSAGWCSVREHGIAFSFDLTRVMFCSGNVTERKRMAAPPTSLALHARVGGALGPVVTTAIIAATAAVAAPATGPATGPSSASTTASAVGRPKKNGHSGPWDALLPVPPQSASQACDSQQANCAAEGGEVIVDLYAGIGYYTLPFLVHFGHKVRSLEQQTNHSLACTDAYILFVFVHERCHLCFVYFTSFNLHPIIFCR